MVAPPRHAIPVFPGYLLKVGQDCFKNYDQDGCYAAEQDYAAEPGQVAAECAEPGHATLTSVTSQT